MAILDAWYSKVPRLLYKKSIPAFIEVGEERRLCEIAVSRLQTVEAAGSFQTGRLLRRHGGAILHSYHLSLTATLSIGLN
jgi:hypothetical protein